MRLLIKDNHQAYTMIGVITVKVGKTPSVLSVDCADGSTAEIKLSSPSSVKKAIDDLNTFGKAEVEGSITWNGDYFDKNNEADNHKIQPTNPPQNLAWHHIVIGIFSIFFVLLCIATIQSDMPVIEYALNPDTLEAGEPVPTLESENEDDMIFKIIHKDGRNRIAYHRETHVMYMLTCNRFRAIIDTEIMLNPDGSPMVWDEAANAPVDYKSQDKD